MQGFAFAEANRLDKDHCGVVGAAHVASQDQSYTLSWSSLWKFLSICRAVLPGDVMDSSSGFIDLAGKMNLDKSTARKEQILQISSWTRHALLRLHWPAQILVR